MGKDKINSDMKKLYKEILSWVIVVCLAVFMAILFRTTVYAKETVDQSSMEDTLFDSQQMIISKLSYISKTPKRGDVITFFVNEDNGSLIDRFLRTAHQLFTRPDKEEESNILVKRVIAVEGDEVDIKDGYTYLNGVKLDEPYAHGVTEEQEFELPITVGKDQLFVMGDNREVSIDSRSFGPVDIKQVEGKVVFRVYPFNKMGKIK